MNALGEIFTSCHDPDFCDPERGVQYYQRCLETSEWLGCGYTLAGHYELREHDKRRGIELDDVIPEPTREQERDLMRPVFGEDQFSQWDAGLHALQHFLEGAFWPEEWRDILFERYAQGDENAYDELTTRLHHICFLEDRDSTRVLTSR